MEKGTIQITATINRDLHKALLLIAQKQGRSLSNLVSRILRLAIDLKII